MRARSAIASNECWRAACHALRMAADRIAQLVAVLVVITAVTSPSVWADPGPLRPRLRIIDPGLLSIVKAGREESPSFRALMDRLDHRRRRLRAMRASAPTPLGRAHVSQRGGGVRYLLVRLDWDQALPRKIAILGHELQHALEVAANPDTVTPTMAKAYERFGLIRRRGVDRVDFDSVAAIDTGHDDLARAGGKHRRGFITG